MTNDPFAQFRKSPRAPGPPEPPEGPVEYQAFSAKNKVRRLRIHDGPDSTSSPGYNILVNVWSNGKLGTSIVLVYTIMTVFVQGKNLQKLVLALEDDMASYIQPFDPERWPAPNEENAAFIESIVVKVGGDALDTLADELKH